MHLPEHLQERERAVADEVRADLDARKLLTPPVEALVRQYATALTDAERLTEDLRRHDPASQEYRRISAARDRAQRLVSSLATKLKLTPRARAQERSEKEHVSIFDLLRAEGITTDD
jgi:hypothetical protein